MKIFFLLWLLLSGISQARGNPDVLDWETVDFADEDNLLDHIKRGISSTLFNLVSTSAKFNQNFFDNRFGVGFKINRSVFGNHDAQESYTVIDSFELPISIPINFTFLTNPNINIGVNTYIKAKTLNIRKVQPQDFDLLRTVEDMQRDGSEIVSRMRAFPKRPKDIDKGVEADLSTPDEPKKTSPFFTNDSEMRARYSTMWNLLIQPFRLPLTEYGVRKMEVNEISTYNLEGYLSFGVGVGWGLAPIDPIYFGNVFRPLAINANISTYVKGEFRVSVLKNSENEAIVKVTKIVGGGVSGGITAGTDSLKPFSGIVIIEGALDLQVIPFSLNANRYWEKEWDVGYKFNLDDPEAVEAYLKAVRGNFKLAQEYALLGDKGVKDVFKRKMTTSGRSFHHNTRISILYNSSRSMDSKFTEAEIIFPDGKRKIFKAYNHVSKVYGGLLINEEHSQNFVVTYDDPKFREGEYQSDLLTLRINGNWRDNRTLGGELADYSRKVKALVGDIFDIPPFPTTSPTTKCVKYRHYEKKIARRIADRVGDILDSGALNYNKEFGDNIDEIQTLIDLCKRSKGLINYKESWFNVRLGLKHAQVQKFIEYPEEKMWQILEKAYGVKEGRWSTTAERVKDGFRNVFQSFFSGPIFVISGEVIKSGTRLFSAKGFIEDWKKLKLEKDYKDLTKRFRKMFQTTFHGYEKMRVVVETMKDLKETFLVHLIARNEETIGNINIMNADFRVTDPIDDRFNDEVNFDRIGNRDTVDELAIISNLRIGRKGKDKVYIIFNVNKKPKYMYFKIDRDHAPLRRINYLKMVLNNKNDMIKEGENIIEITPDDKEGIKGKLSPFLFSSQRIALGMAMSNTGIQWGFLINKRLKGLKRASKL